MGEMKGWEKVEHNVVHRGVSVFWHRDKPDSRGLSMRCELSRQVPFPTKSVAPSPLIVESVAEPEEYTKSLRFAGNLQQRRHSPMTRTVYTGTSRKLVLAFDIGTTFSGAAYAFLDPGEVPKIQSVTK